MDFDHTLEDILRLSYRLSWPAPKAPARDSLRKILHRAFVQRLEGWPVALSAPACQ